MLKNPDLILTAIISFLGGGGGATLITSLFNARKNKVSIEIDINKALRETLDSVQEQYQLVLRELTEVRKEMEVLRDENATLRARIGKCEHSLE